MNFSSSIFFFPLLISLFSFISILFKCIIRKISITKIMTIPFQKNLMPKVTSLLQVGTIASGVVIQVITLYVQMVSFMYSVALKIRKRNTYGKLSLTSILLMLSTKHYRLRKLLTRQRNVQTRQIRYSLIYLTITLSHPRKRHRSKIGGTTNLTKPTRLFQTHTQYMARNMIQVATGISFMLLLNLRQPC